MKNKNTTVGTVNNKNFEIIERSKIITPNMQIFPGLVQVNELHCI